MEKRPLLTAAAAMIATPLVIGLHARYWQPYRPVLERLTLSVPTGHRSLAGLRIGFISDTHVGPFISGNDIERAVALLMSEAPDLVLLGGDYISESPRYAGVAAAALRPLVAAPLGCLAVLGNHDISTDPIKVSGALDAVGICVLRNESVRLETLHGPLWIAGVDETILGSADVNETFAGIPPGAAVIALWHEPDGAAEAAACGAFAQFSGHSHGGQIRLPGIGPLALPPGGRTYPAGRYQIGEMTLYTARGAGVYRPAVRLNCRPEVTLITLTR